MDDYLREELKRLTIEIDIMRDNLRRAQEESGKLKITIDSLKLELGRLRAQHEIMDYCLKQDD